MTVLPKSFFCWSLRTGTFVQGVICLVIVGINIIAVSYSLGDIMERITYHFCGPMKECYDKFVTLEKYLIHANIIINALLLSFNLLLLFGVKNERPCQMIPFMILQGFMISGLVAASATALMICFHDESWAVFIAVLVISLVYVCLHIYMAMVNLAYYKELMELKRRKASICKSEKGDVKEFKEMTLEDYVFS